MTGEVQPRPELCQLCAPATYSFNPTAPTCNAPCPANADCFGGSTLVPHTGYWHSAYTSEAMDACPNPSACQGDRGALLACQDSSNTTGKVDIQHQVGIMLFLQPERCILPSPAALVLATCVMCSTKYGLPGACHGWGPPRVSDQSCIARHCRLSAIVHLQCILSWLFCWSSSRGLCHAIMFLMSSIYSR